MGKSAPKTPDPYKVAEAQTKSNIETAQAQQKLGMTGQETPWGSIQYVADPNSPSGYRAVTEMSEGQQGLFDQNQALQGQLGDIRSQQLGQLGGLMGTPFDMDAARGRELSDINRTFLDPQWSQRDESFEASLLNRGIRPGSAQYEQMMRQHGQQRNDAYNQMYLGAYNTANNAALQERQRPFQEFAALSGAATPQQQSVNPANAPSPGVAPTDLTSGVWNAYNQQMNQANQAMGGLYGIGSSLAGGWAGSAAGSTAISNMMAALPLISDRRMKTDIERIGDDPRGFGVYRYRYIFDDEMREGFLAQEVERERPDAVFTTSNGIKAVDYAALAEETA